MFRKRCEGATSSYTNLRVLAVSQRLVLPLPFMLAPPLLPVRTGPSIASEILRPRDDEGWGATLVPFMSAEAGIQYRPLIGKLRAKDRKNSQRQSVFN